MNTVLLRTLREDVDQAQTYSDIIRACRRTVNTLRQSPVYTRLCTRYVQRFDHESQHYCLRTRISRGPVVGLGIAYYHKYERNYIYIGGSHFSHSKPQRKGLPCKHCDDVLKDVLKDVLEYKRPDTWNKYLGITLAALRAVRVPVRLAFQMSLYEVPPFWTKKSPPSYSQFDTLQHVPREARVAAVTASKLSLLGQFNPDSEFDMADIRHRVEPSFNSLQLARKLLDKACNLPRYTEEYAAELRAANEAVIPHIDGAFESVEHVRQPSCVGLPAE